MTIIENVLIIIVTVAAGFVVAYLRKRIGIEGMHKIEAELALKQELAELAVRFVEQVYKDLHGQEKYSQAAQWLEDRAGEAGLEITANEIKGLIEAALRAFKDEFGEQWAKVAVAEID
jgi:LL-H family phage holin